MDLDRYFTHGLKSFLIVTAVTIAVCTIIWLSVGKKTTATICATPDMRGFALRCHCCAVCVFRHWDADCHESGHFPPAGSEQGVRQQQRHCDLLYIGSKGIHWQLYRGIHALPWQALQNRRYGLPGCAKNQRICDRNHIPAYSHSNGKRNGRAGPKYSDEFSGH